MSTWDTDIFTSDANAEFLDELAELDIEEVREAVRDAVLLGASESATADEVANGRAAATIAAIWAGAPFSAGEVADTYGFLRNGAADVDEKIAELAVALLEDVEGEEDVDQFIEALS
ncbi:DUF4259 domain-containing protein [Corynebacterium timonense]|uniref:DUF4259 domain-containing protein n=1 Tax=Corynebacterium timonense TaxID=441500 RepID=A0A1H1RRM9_9CORY|nr:DUF4259 domain-containing protein [Corynebacterium timonense]SDS38387.1 protein of unknown function [Corynebacterium timonense]